MATIVSALERIANNANLSQVNYRDINENQSEFIRQDHWDLSMITKPLAVWYPGDSYFKSRVTEVNPSISGDISGIEHVIRGYTIKQKTSYSTSGTFSYSVVDRVDQVMTNFHLDWKKKISDPDNKYSFGKDETYADFRYVIMSVKRVPLRTINFLTCQPSDVPTTEEGTSDAEQSSSNSQFEVTIDYEHYQRELYKVV